MSQAMVLPVDRLPMAPAVSESAAILSVIERLATNPDIDPERLERYMAMYERMEAKKAQQAFFAAFAAAQAEMPQIVRNAENKQTSSRYAKYETISDAIQPIITKHGFSLTFGEARPDKENHLRITCKVMHEAGHSEDGYYAEIPLDMFGMKGNPNKTPTHAYGSTKSYGRRYLKLDIFDIAVKNQDDDGNAASGSQEIVTISEEQVAELRELITASRATPEKFCEITKIDAIPDLPAAQFVAAKEMLQSRLAKLKAKTAAVDPKTQFDAMERSNA